MMKDITNILKIPVYYILLYKAIQKCVFILSTILLTSYKNSALEEISNSTYRTTSDKISKDKPRKTAEQSL